MTEETHAPRDETVLSPSQIETWVSCPRKGAFKYMAGLEDPGNEDTDVGKRFHKVLENWLVNGIAPDEETQEGRMAMVALGYLPLPLTPEEKDEEGKPITDRLRVEGEFTFDMHGVKMLGYKDLEHWRDQTFVVHDHKSCGSFKYMKKADDLRNDVQAVTYAQHAFQAHPELSELEENWDYTTKWEEPAHRRTHLTVYRDETDEKAKQIADIGKEILRIKATHGRTIADINELPFNLDICGKFRGCPYRDVCDLTPMQRARAKLRFTTQKGQQMNFAEMKARLAQANGNKTETAPTTTQASTPAPSTDKPVATTPTQTIREKVGATGINPPTATQPTVTPTTSAALTGVLQASVEANDTLARLGTNGRTNEKAQEVLQQVAHSLEGQDPKLVATEATSKRGKGRPPGAKNKPKADELAQTTTDAPDERDLEAFTLFINCVPCKTNYSLIMFSDLIAPVHEAIRTEYGAIHWSLIDHGQGKGVLADALKQKLEAEPPGRAVGIVVNDRDPDVGPCLGVLERAARVVVRGF